MQYYEVYLLLGSNLGERATNIADGVSRLADSEVKPVMLSALYETEPWGNTRQPKFLNQAGQFKTQLPAGELMKVILDIEQAMGRQRIKKWEPRILDIDILLYGDKIVSEPGINIPHPELEKRKFALTPLSEIAPDFIHPVLKKNIKHLLAACNDTMAVNFFQP